MADSLRSAVWKIITGDPASPSYYPTAADESATSISLCGADVPTDSASNPLRKPAGQVGRSYVRWVKVYLKNLTSTATTVVSNGKIYFNVGGLRQEAHIFFKLEPNMSNYAVYDDQYDLSANGGIDISTVDENNKQVLNFTEVNGDYESDLIMLQAQIEAGARWTGSLSGTGTAPSIFIEYDEM